MAVNLVSPGVKIREVDLTIGGLVQNNDQVAAFVGPFEKGPVEIPTLITSESELIKTFGYPRTDKGQNAYWLTASNYLTYGGVLQIVRADSSVTGAMNNSFAPAVGIGTTVGVKIKSPEDYINILNDSNDSSLSTDAYFVAKNPGSWANGLKVYVIDSAADQIVSGISTASIVVGCGVTATITNKVYAGAGTTSVFNGFIKGIVTGVGASSVDVKITARYDNSTNTYSNVDYQENNDVFSITSNSTVRFTGIGSVTAFSTTTSYQVTDWYNQQKIVLDDTRYVYWKNVAARPSSSQFAAENSGKNDEVNIAVVDSNGSVEGVVGQVIEKFERLSKASDGKVTPAQPTFYRDYIRDNSKYIYAGALIPTVNSRFSDLSGFSSASGGDWNTSVRNNSFKVSGNVNYTLTNGTDYITSGGSFGVPSGNIIDGYSLFSNPTETQINFIIGGPSETNIFASQAKANHIISIANDRKDCIAIVSPHETDVTSNTIDSNVQTDNIVKFFSGVSRSNYAIYDSNYKYTFDRYNNAFLYMGCNSDVAGLMARASINNYPWYSPAGATRGVLNNVVKLAYNPSASQRDKLYANNINPIIASPGQGFILYGDKTASAYVSAFDRINVRRLFLTLEQTIESAARAQLFEFNDAITRTNFVNIVEPYLREVRAKRGVSEYLVICDESNNTPDIIDSNQFRADIYIKPTRVTNFIGLTFVATRTGISFSEIVGTV